MRAIMVDLHKTDALLFVTNLQHGNEEVNNIYYAEVMEKHGVTQAQFDSSLVWYTAHPQLFDKIYPKVIDQLEKEEAAFLAEHFSGTDEEAFPAPQSSTPARDPLTKHEMDSILWVMQNGYPSIWHPLPTPFSLFVN